MLRFEQNVANQEHLKWTRRKLLKRTFFAAAGAFVGDAFFVEPKMMSLEKVALPIRGLSPAFEGYRIALFSDIHLWRANVDPEVPRVLLSHNPD